MRTKHLVDGKPKYTNELAQETSPYLLQHAHNPVAWRAWNPASLAEARATDRPIFLSVGYSTCHWCHVMEEESFEDENIARVINEHFIPIKVDREERPDVDGIYMTAVQALTGHGGWPMSVFMTPLLKPFFAGTYFPAKDGDRGSSIGFLTILGRLAETWMKDRSRVDLSADEITRELSPLFGAPAPTDLPSLDVVEGAVGFFSSRYDPVWGGLAPAPKFPSSLPIRVLLRHHARSGERAVLEMAVTSFQKMAEGGLRDHVAGGFHRYSTDEKWLVPHFEKMLYDNALLVMSGLEVFQVTGAPPVAEVVKDTLRYIERDMTSPDGAYYSATDADSLNDRGEREEGWFFTWTPNELVRELGAERARVCTAAWNITARGNFEGRSILWRPRPLADVAKDLDIPIEDVARALTEAKETLYRVRNARPLPLRDEKILAAWNGLTISAFARASFVLDEPRYKTIASTAAAFVLDKMRGDDGRLWRTFKDGTAKNAGTLEDHAFMLQACLDTFEATGAPRWLDDARALERIVALHFADAANGGFYLAPDDASELLARAKPSHDGAEPSGNSVHALNLARLAALLDDAALRTRAERTVRAFGQVLRRHPAAMAEMLLALEMLHAVPKEIVVVARDLDAADVRALLQPLRTAFLPNRVLVQARAADALASVVPHLQGRVAVDDKPTVYVCERRACKLPATTVDELRAALAG
jgi:uncharacterized protein YyaL (SSP411 family)